MQFTINGCLSTLRLCAVGIMLATLAACQTPPVVTPLPLQADLSQEQQEILLGLGFTKDEKGWTLITAGRLLFAVDSDVLLPELRIRVDNVARTLLKAGIDRFRVEGHTDDQGAAAYNDELSLRRAKVVAKVLIDAGIAADRVDVRGYGFSRPLQKNTTGAARQENRRVAIVIPAL